MDLVGVGREEWWVRRYGDNCVYIGMSRYRQRRRGPVASRSYLFVE